MRSSRDAIASACRKQDSRRCRGRVFREVTLKAGERKTDLNVTIQRGAAIVGRVLDENGEPIANANVVAWRRPPVPNGSAAPARLGLIPAGFAAQTNDLGEFRLFGLAPGEVYVQATSRPDFGRSASPRLSVPLATYFPGTADVVGAMPITLAAGQTSGDITIRMVSAPAFQVSGVVTDERGRPVENALVRLLLEMRPGEPPMPFMDRMQSARSENAGKFTISGVVNGSYTLLATAPVLLSTPDASRGGAAGAGTSTSFTSGTVTGGVVSEFVGGGVTTETVNGVTTRYRDDAGTRVAVTVNDASVAGVEWRCGRRPDDGAASLNSRARFCRFIPQGKLRAVSTLEGQGRTPRTSLRTQNR
jgi:carboxypeptidase family protein